MNKKSIILIFFIFLMTTNAFSQKNYSIDGYFSNMLQYSFVNDANLGYYDTWNTVVQNRLNFEYFPNNNINIYIQCRNQLVWGDNVKSPFYAQNFAKDRGFFDLSFNWFENSNSFINTQVDRAYIQYSKGKFELSIGRQRVNWGRTMVWNPNDLFNSFSYYDFDYQERPGSDAIRMQYYLNSTSSIEFVSSIDSLKDITTAALYKTNVKNFDIQFLGALSKSQDIVIGTGWEGALGLVGFKGELSYYHPLEQFSDSLGSLIASLSFDYVFKNNIIVQLEMLYNDKKTLLDISDLSSIYSAPASSKSLSFSSFNILANVVYQINPILSFTAAAMYYPDYKGLYIMPTFNISLSDNAGLAIMYQYFNLELNGVRFDYNLAFLRYKWNF